MTTKEIAHDIYFTFYKNFATEQNQTIAQIEMDHNLPNKVLIVDKDNNEFLITIEKVNR